jgi:hypothetical protein
MHTNSPDPNKQALFSTFLLSLIRAATLRSELDTTELKSVGIALKAGWIAPDHACAWLADAGLLNQVIGEEPRGIATVLTDTGVAA